MSPPASPDPSISLELPPLSAAHLPPSPTDPQELITHLRESLTTSQTLLAAQSDRLTAFADLELTIASQRDQLTFLAAAKEAVEGQLRDERSRREQAEETVETLRGQVESARRGVMTLQKQEKDRKRMSTIGGPPVSGLSWGGDEEVLVDNSRSKRSSIMVKPQTHKRLSSQSDNTDFFVAPAPPPPAPAASNTNAKTGLRELRLGATTLSPSAIASSTVSFDDIPIPSGRRLSSNGPETSSAHSSPSKRESAAVEEATRLRLEITTLQKRLDEAEEARTASEVCLKALREFMASSQTSDPTAAALSLPPLPTEGDGEGDSLAPPKSKSGWGLKTLWRANPASPNPSTTSAPSQSPRPEISPRNIDLPEMEESEDGPSSSTWGSRSPKSEGSKVFGGFFSRGSTSAEKTKGGLDPPAEIDVGRSDEWDAAQAEEKRLPTPPPSETVEPLFHADEADHHDVHRPGAVTS